MFSSVATLICHGINTSNTLTLFIICMPVFLVRFLIYSSDGIYKEHLIA